MTLTNEELTAIRAGAKAAAPGPWGYEYEADTTGHIYEHYVVAHNSRIAITFGESDAQFIAAARTDIPELLATIDRLRAENAAAMKVVQAVAYNSSSGWGCYCVGLGHRDGCLVLIARALLAQGDEPKE